MNPIGGGPGGSAPTVINDVGEVGGIGGVGGWHATSSGVGGWHATSSGVGGWHAPSSGGYNAVGGSAGATPTGLTVPGSMVGTWTGYVENYKFEDRSDAVTLVLGSDGSSQVTFGNSPPPAPATDPDLGYPIEVQAQGGYSGVSITSHGAFPGYAYVVNGSEANNRLQFEANLGQLWTHWCEIQTPVAQDNGSYGCIPNWATSQGGPGVDCAMTNPQTGEPVPINCIKLQLCWTASMCQCTEESCALSPYSPGGTANFDLNVDGNKANGSVAFDFDAGAHNVHLVKQ